MTVPLRLPTLQNWTCQSCAGCCREHLIELSPEEVARLDDQGWTGAAGGKPTPGGVPPVVPLDPASNLLAGGGFVPGKWLPDAVKNRARWRLNHAPGGACAFLRPDGLCAVHAEFGEAAKPLACRVYPYALHPDRRGVTVSLRFSCPTVAANDGAAVTDNAAEVRRIAAEVLPEGYEPGPPPRLTPTQRVEWKDFQRVADALAGLFDPAAAEPPDVPAPASFAHRLLRGVFVASLIHKSRFEKVTGTG